MAKKTIIKIDAQIGDFTFAPCWFLILRDKYLHNSGPLTHKWIQRTIAALFCPSIVRKKDLNKQTK